MRGNDEGTPCVTEINPGRFFTPSFMYAKSGYNIVKTFFEIALGSTSKSQLKQRALVAKNIFWIRGIDLEPTIIQLNKLPSPGEEVLSN